MPRTPNFVHLAAVLAAVAAPVAGATPPQLLAPATPHEAPPPWTLTASDGAGLVLSRVDARAVVEGPLAFTELHLYFHNPEARIREGRFAIALPEGASVSRFAIDDHGHWQEAEVVDKALARRAYEDFLHRRQDPALLEKAAGNQFTARVFPIPARADEHLVISFSQAMAGHGYTLPLRGLPTIGRIDVRLATTALDGTRTEQTLHERAWRPDHDFAASSVAPAAVAAGELVVAAVEVIAPAATPVDAPPSELTLLVDTSASRALGFAGYVRSIHALIDALQLRFGATLPLRVVAFDQDRAEIFDGPAAAYGDAQDRALLDRGAAGASNLGQAVEPLRATGARSSHARVVVITDGVLTAGPDATGLASSIRALPAERLDVVLAGGIRDAQLAGSIARAGLPRAGDVFDLDDPADLVAAGLGQPVVANVTVRVPGASWSYPKQWAAARPGTIQLVYARMARPTRTLDLVIGGTRRTVQLGAATPALVERAVDSAEIDELEHEVEAAPEPAAAALRTQLARRAVKARVISSQTSMLMLETDADYARYQIDRASLDRLLVVGPRGVEPRARQARARPRPRATDDLAPDDLPPRDLTPDRRAPAPPAQVADRAPSITPAAPTTTIAMSRGAGAGYGRGGGRGAIRYRVAAVPSVSIGQPMAVGSLDKAIIRRYLKRRLAKLQYCYERELQRRPRIHGVITARFTIAPTGQVIAAEASGFDPTVAACVAGVIAALEFPQADDQILVTYPFTFRRADQPGTEPDPAPVPAALPTTGGGEAPPVVEPLIGTLATVTRQLQGGQVRQALDLATAWHDRDPGDVLALIGLGEALEANHELARAARTYGSIIDLYPSRADLRRFAGERLERLGPATRALVIDSYRRAVVDRPDHLTGHRLLAYALVRSGDDAGGLAAILAGFDQRPPAGRFAGAERVLGEDAGMIAAVYLAHGGDRGQVLAELARRGLELPTGPSTRVVLYWETDANDVDLHVRDHQGGHAYYEQKALPSGGDLYTDVTTGYGPECFAIQGRPSAGPYRVSVHYYAQGPMGYGMGLVQIVRFDGTSLQFDDRPYVVMQDRATVELGTFD